MTAAEHIQHAEDILTWADGDEVTASGAAAGIATAQVHATLAVAEATLQANRLRPAQTDPRWQA